jgi:hypothetical protein
MRGGVSKSRARRSHLNPFKASQGKLLDAVASKSAGIAYRQCPCFRRAGRHANSSGTEFPPSHRHRFPVGGDLAQGTTPLQSGKRQLDAASTSHLLPAKRARLTRTDVQTRKHSIISARWVKHANVSDTGTSRRSARLQTRQHSTGGEGPTPIAQSAPPREPQTEAGAGSVPLPSKQAGLPRTNTQQVENEEVEEAAKVGQRSLTQVNN